jgi:hypothetical protein
MNDDGEMTAELLAKKLHGKILPPRHALARSITLGLNDVRLAMIVAERMADRLEGKPVQKLRHELPHTTIFYRAGDPKPRRWWPPRRRRRMRETVGPLPPSPMALTRELTCCITEREDRRCPRRPGFAWTLM